MINIQNIDNNECCNSSIVRYVNPENHHSSRITNADKKDLVKKLDSKGIKFLMKIRDIQKIEKKNSVRISVFDDENKKSIQYMMRRRKTC